MHMRICRNAHMHAWTHTTTCPTQPSSQNNCKLSEPYMCESTLSYMVASNLFLLKARTLLAQGAVSLGRSRTERTPHQTSGPPAP